MSTTLTINLKRASKIYHEGETIVGVVVVDTGGGDTRHEGLALVLEGAVSLQLGARGAAAGILDAFSNNIKELGLTRLLATLPGFMHSEVKSPIQDIRTPIPLVSSAVELAGAGRLPPGATAIPFEVPLRARTPASPALLETYHGVFVNVMYTLKCTMKRPLFNKPLHTTCQFFVQHPHQEAPPLKPVRCEITPASIRAGAAAGAGGAMPQFQIYAELHSTVCALDKPLAGKIRVEQCSAAIKSIELQLVRVETCGAAPASARDATEIQNIQVACGDVLRARDVPLHMVLPRLFTCPTTATNNFKIEFELNIAVIFEDDYLVTENFPILLLRSR